MIRMAGSSPAARVPCRFILAALLAFVLAVLLPAGSASAAATAVPASCVGGALSAARASSSSAAATTTAPVHGYDGRAQHARPREASSNGIAVDATAPARNAGVVAWDHAGAAASRVAAETGGGGTTSIFRAVSKGEADDIAENGFRQAPNGRSLEAKLFATNAEDAARYGRINYGIDGQPFHIVEARVPTSFVDQLYAGTADRMPFLGVNPGQLGELNRVANTSLWDSVPWVAKP